MLTKQELRAAWHLVGEAVTRSSRYHIDDDRYLELSYGAQALEYAVRAYAVEQRRTDRAPRLDCLTTAVRALAGALRDRMAGDG